MKKNQRTPEEILMDIHPLLEEFKEYVSSNPQNEASIIFVGTAKHESNKEENQIMQVVSTLGVEHDLIEAGKLAVASSSNLGMIMAGSLSDKISESFSDTLYDLMKEDEAHPTN